MKFYKLHIIILWFFLISCNSNDKNSLPVLGEFHINDDGTKTHYKAPDFEFKNQLNYSINQDIVEGKIHIVDFFFTSCPSICPIMTSHLVDVQEHFKEEDKLAILSYSIDSSNDTPERLLSYAKNYGVNPQKWQLLTGNSDDIFKTAKGYKVMAFDDSLGEEKNLIHDGTFVLLDEKRRVRGYYNGLEKNDVNRLIVDIEKLIKQI